MCCAVPYRSHADVGELRLDSSDANAHSGRPASIRPRESCMYLVSPLGGVKHKDFKHTVRSCPQSPCNQPLMHRGILTDLNWGAAETIYSGENVNILSGICHYRFKKCLLKKRL